MYAEVTVNALSPVVASDILGLEAGTPEANFTRMSADAGQTTVIRCSGAVWDRIRPQLRKLSQRRIPALDALGVVIAGKTAPIMTYTMVWVPGARPKINQVEGAVSVAGGAALTVRGEGLIPGLKSVLRVYRQRQTQAFGPAGITQQYVAQELIMTVTAKAVGPIGDKIGLLILAASGAGSVTTQEYADGKVLITVVPAAGLNTVTAIKAQIDGDALASVWVSVTADVGAALVAATQSSGEIQGPNVAAGSLPFQYLAGGDGCGLAFADIMVSGVDPTNRLRITAQRAGNQGNLVSLTIIFDALAVNGVAVTGNDIVVTRTATTAIGALVTAINANAAALALVKASAVGAGNILSATKTYLAGGAGEQPTATVGGAPGAITEQSDTSMLVAASAVDLGTAGVVAGEVAVLSITSDYQRLAADMVAAA
mgnify:CR=1 FL=1